jgi:hypothetical protein
MNNASELWNMQTPATDGSSKPSHKSAVTLLITIFVVVFFLLPAAGYLVSAL